VTKVKHKQTEHHRISQTVTHLLTVHGTHGACGSESETHIQSTATITAAADAIMTHDDPVFHNTVARGCNYCHLVL